VSTGLTVCYSFSLFYFVLCGDFNFVPSYSLVEINYNMIIGMVGLLVISVFGGGSLIWLICPTTPVICLPYYLRFVTLFVVFLCVWLGYEIAVFLCICTVHGEQNIKKSYCFVTVCNLIGSTLCRSRHSLSSGYKR
jgi:hypothetical protein